MTMVIISLKCGQSLEREDHTWLRARHWLSPRIKLIPKEDGNPNVT